MFHNPSLLHALQEEDEVVLVDGHFFAVADPFFDFGGQEVALMEAVH